MNKTERSGRLLKAAFAVSLSEKRLLLFPVIALALILTAALFFLFPLAMQPTGYSYTSASHWTAVFQNISHLIHSHDKEAVAKSQLWAPPFLVVAYFVSMFLGTFCNVAFYHEIMQALNGNTVSIRNGFQFAFSRWRSILLWSLFAGLVGYIIQTIEERLSILGRFITSFIGISWSVASIFVIPTLVCGEETANPLKLLRHSANTLKRTWGELVIGFIGTYLGLGYAILVVVIMMMILSVNSTAIVGYSFSNLGWWIMASLIGVLLFMLSMCINVINSIYRCALYIYATEGVIPYSFDKELLDSAWKVK